MEANTDYMDSLEEVEYGDLFREHARETPVEDGMGMVVRDGKATVEVHRITGDRGLCVCLFSDIGEGRKSALRFVVSEEASIALYTLLGKQIEKAMEEPGHPLHPFLAELEPAELEPGPIPAPLLTWSPTAPPCEECRYHHTRAETPFGTFLLTWKGWKTGPGQDPGYGFDETPWGGVEYHGWKNVEEAQAWAEAEMRRRIGACTAKTH